MTTPIEQYGYLSDCRSGALVGPDGCIDWWCVPRFDSPSVFGRLLDPDAGHWSLGPVQDATCKPSYVGDSLVLRTTVRAGEGEAVVTDALLLAPGARGHDIGRASPGVLVRHVLGLRGAVRFRTEFAPRFEYGLTRVRLRAAEGQINAAAGPVTLRLTAPIPLHCDGGTAAGEFAVGAREEVEFRLAYEPSYGPPARSGAEVEDTIRGWQSWADQHGNYQGRYAVHVRRSAVVLQGLTYARSGAILAAATTSLPERSGGTLNWDYRYTWLRDLTLTMRALWVAACPDEADRFFAWIAAAMGQLGDRAVQIMFGVEGERDLTEHTLEHLAGYAGSRPVRVGNDAWDQRQLDVAGEVLDAAFLLRDQLEPFDEDLRTLLVALADEACKRWDQPDSGMWEARDRQRHYLSSKVLCWVALDRAISLAEGLGAAASVERWAATRDEIRRTVLQHGWNEEAGAYTGAFGSDQLDASVLLLPLVGFVEAGEDRMRRTIDAIERVLGRDGTVRRWDGDTAGFFLCSYWLVECLALAGDLDRAVEWFERISGKGGPLGLLAEEYDPTSGRQLGNYPQAFSHVGLINAAWRLTQLLPEERT